METELLDRTTFGQLIEEGALEIGDGYRAKNSELGGDGPIFLRAGHVRGTHIDFEGVERFRKELEPRLGAKMSEPGDTIVTTKGNSTGRTAFVSRSMPRFVYSPHLSYWRSKDPDRIEGGFLRYWSRGPEFAEQLAGMKASTDMAPYLSLIDQKRLRISLPSIEKQRAIANTLGALDDKIELNRQMSEALEQMARALFESWFDGLDVHRVRVEDLTRAGVLEIGDGYRAKNSELGDPGLPFIRAGNLDNDFDTEGADSLRSESVGRAGSKVSRPGDIAFTSKGTVGRFAWVHKHTPPFVYSPQVCFWRSLRPDLLERSVLYLWMKSTDLRLQIEGVAGQTDMAPYVSLRD